ncbi:MAG: hypothetical protein RLZZ444_1045, partial [Pseudomonadota bacterium]
MAALLNISTMMLCTAIMTFVVGLALAFIWYFERRERAVGLWCLAMLVGTFSSSALALRGIGPDWLSMGIGNAVALLAYG